MAHLGEVLRKQRLSRGVELSNISTQTRISGRYLELLENGKWDQLPGALFARSFARQYAQAVGLEIDTALETEIRNAFPDEDPGPPVVEEAGPPRFQFSWTPLRDLLESGLESSRLPVYAVALAGVIGACSLVYVGWQRFVLPSETVAESRSQVPVPTMTVPRAAAPQGAASSNVTPDVAMREASAGGAATKEGVQVSTKDLGNGTAEMEMVVADAVAEGMAVRIVASQETWVSISANGKKLYSGILQPNEVRSLRGAERAQVVIGNAGGVEVSRDGRSIGPIGNPGEVRVVELTPQGPPLIKKNPPPPAEGEPGEAQTRTDD